MRWQRSGLTQSKTEQKALILRVAMLHGKQKSRSRLTTGRSPLDHEGLSPSSCTKSVSELDRASSFVWIHLAETETQIPVTVTSLQQALIQQLSWPLAPHHHHWMATVTTECKLLTVLTPEHISTQDSNSTTTTQAKVHHDGPQHNTTLFFLRYWER